MKKILIITTLLAMLLCSCGKEKEDNNIANAINLPPPTSSVNIKRDTLAYSMVVDEKKDNGWLIPSLILYQDDNTYLLHYDVLSSYISTGNYTVNDNIITCNDETYGYVYVFEKTDDGIKFKESESSEIKLINKDVGYKIEDGSLFKLPELE